MRESQGLGRCSVVSYLTVPSCDFPSYPLLSVSPGCVHGCTCWDEEGCWVWAPPPWSLPALLLLDTGVGHGSSSMLSQGKCGALFLGFPFIARLWACVLSALFFFLSFTLFKNVFSLYLVPGSQWHDGVGWGWGPTPLTPAVVQLEYKWHGKHTVTIAVLRRCHFLLYTGTLW